MSNYTKNRNIITINIDGVGGEYKLDLNTAILYGVRGSAIKRCPAKSTVARLFSRENTNLAVALCSMISRCSLTSEYAPFVKTLSGAEKMDAIGCRNLYLSIEQYDVIADNFDKFSKFYNSVSANGGQVTYPDFVSHLKYELAKEKLGKYAEQVTPEIWGSITNYFREAELTHELIDILVYYLIRGKYYQYHRGNISNLRRYIDLCAIMNKVPQKVNNFMREYIETVTEYELKKTEYDNNRLKANYAKQEKAFSFEYGDFVVVVPTCGQDIVNEGANMHHCVGGYVGDVVENRTYIVFVRHKNTPNQCYLTCQVGLNGTIGQYYLAYDRYISSAEDREFREQFQKHLLENWVV